MGAVTRFSSRFLLSLIELSCPNLQDMQYLASQYDKLMMIALNQPRRWTGRRLAHRLGLSPLKAYIEKRRLQFIGVMARAHDKQPILPSMALGGRLSGQYTESDHTGPSTWRKVAKQTLRDAMEGVDKYSDRVARDQAAWKRRETIPLQRAASEEVGCQLCHRHYNVRYITRHLRDRHSESNRGKFHRYTSTK